MKKTYKKPAIIVERFELSQNVADCTWNMNYSDNGTCIGDGSDKRLPMLFSEGLNCSLYPEAVEDYCYTNSQSGKNIFLS